MANPSTNFDLVCVFVGLLARVTLVCPGVDPHPLQESIVPERDLPPRNFNPHPYVSAVAGAAVLSNFDHPYAAIASKRSRYFRNGPNTAGRNNDLSTNSINSLANFARRFLGLGSTPANGKKRVVTNDLVIGSDPISLPYKFSVPNINNYLVENPDPAGGYGIFDYRTVQDRQNNGQLNRPKFASGDHNKAFGYTDGNVEERLGKVPSTLCNYYNNQWHRQLYLGRTANLVGVRQSSLNEDALSLGDTNDNLSQGFYITNYDVDDSERVSDTVDYIELVTRDSSINGIGGIKARNKPFGFMTSDLNHQLSINDQLRRDPSRYSLYF